MRALPRLGVTAYACCNALGASANDMLAALRAGSTGLRPAAASFGVDTFVGSISGALPELPPASRELESRVARFACMTLDAMTPAIESAKRKYGASRVGIVLGSSTGGLERSEQAFARNLRGEPSGDYDFLKQHAFDGLAELVAHVTGVTGPRYVISTACSSSAKVFGCAQRLMAADFCDAVIVGGADALCDTTIRGFDSLGILSKQPCRPFSASRDGLSIGEGCALLLLERNGEGPARLLAAGESTDAHHMSAPHPEARGAIAAMRAALLDGGVVPGAIDYVNAHGTGTKQNDAIEARAIREILGASVPVSSTKGATGHMLGAAGATEAIVSIMCIEHGLLPASIGALPADETLGVALVATPRRAPVRHVLSNSFAFGGSNVSLLFGADE